MLDTTDERVPVEFTQLELSRWRWFVIDRSPDDGTGWYVFGADLSTKRGRRSRVVAARPDIPFKYSPNYRLKIRRGWRTMREAQDVADALNAVSMERNPAQALAASKPKPLEQVQLKRKTLYSEVPPGHTVSGFYAAKRAHIAPGWFVFGLCTNGTWSTFSLLAARPDTNLVRQPNSDKFEHRKVRPGWDKLREAQAVADYLNSNPYPGGKK